MAEEDHDKLLADARGLFELCRDADEHNRKTARDDITFARDNDQWPDQVRKQRETDGRPCLTINRMPAFIRQVINDARQNKPAIRVHPVDSGADKATAEVMDGLIRNIEYTSNADVAYDTAIESAVSGGFGFWRVGLDYAYDDAFEMDIKIERVLNQFAVYGDPHSRAADSSDWDVAFVIDRLSKEAFKREYPDAEMVDWEDSAWSEAGDVWLNDEGVLVAEWWTREKYDRVVCLYQDVQSGQTYTYGADDVEEDEDLQVAIDAGVLVKVDERTTKSCRVIQRIMSGVEILKEEEWPGKYIPIVPVYGDEFDIEGKRYFRSLIHNAKDAQRMFNYWRTASTELVALAPRVPYIGPKGAFDSDMERWNTANTESHPFLEYDSEVPPQRQPLDGGAAAGALQEALNASDDMKSIIGLYDASLGARSNETSGRAIMARQREGDVSTFHFIDNLSRAIRHTGRILIDLIPKVYNTPRMIRVIGEDGSQAAKMVNKEAPATDKKGNPILDDNGAPVMALHDLTAGKYDLTVKSGPSFTTRREEAAYSMTEALRAFPQAAPVIMPELAKNLDWPGAEDIAERLEQQQQAQIPPEIEKQFQEMQTRLQQLEEENQQLQLDQRADIIKAQSQAEISRMKAEADIAVQQMKAEAEIQIQREKAAGDVEVSRQKARFDADLSFERMNTEKNLEMVRADASEVEGEGGKKTMKGNSGAKAIMDGLVKLGEMQQATRDDIKELARIMAAPTAIDRDPKTGRATGSRKVVN